MKKITAILAALAAAAAITVSSCAEELESAHPFIVYSLEENESNSVVEYEIVVSQEAEQDGRLFLENDQSSGNEEEKSFTIKELAKKAVVALVIGLVFALVICLVMKSRMKTAVPKATANDYIRKNSFNITRSRDIFIYANVTKRKRVKEEKKM